MMSEYHVTPEGVDPSTATQICAKFDACWGMNKDLQRTPNMFMLSQYLFTSFYEPHGFGPIPTNDQFPDRQLILTTPFVSATANPPERTQFVARMRHAFTREVDYRACLYPDVELGLAELGRRGFVTIWSSGDTTGLPDKQIPGSHQQIFKIARAGIKYMLQSGSTVSFDQKMYAAMTAENKLSLLPSLFAAIKSRGHRVISLAEDSPEHIRAFVNLANQNGLTVQAFFFTRPGSPAARLSEHALKDLPAQYVSSLTEMLDTLTGSEDEHVLDYDYVLSDDLKRTKLFKQTLLRVLSTERWI